ncbi:ABC-three component system protein [Amycolatopsis thermoflava]|uniref:ABC-three component system protein n=1 Tax=Amycolatopsis thermoflava TaxID=84480 RepID=UPI000483FC14|nr:ABC-three component system protein [Amycolatopsis thermoflava]
MAASTHGAGPSAVGYQHQTWWALVELLRAGPERPDAAITLELHDDVAWEENGSPTELLQVKHHQRAQRSLTDSSVDVWRTLRVWMDEANPGDPDGPKLVLVTTQTAGVGSAMEALRPRGRNASAALTALENIASTSRSQETDSSRKQFLALSSSERRTFVSRIVVLDGSPSIDDASESVRIPLHWTLPMGHEDLFLSLVWRWWDQQALAMLQGRLARVDVSAAQQAIAEIRDRFTMDNLPTLVELVGLNVGDIERDHASHAFVHQMRWVDYPPKNLQKAMIDYYRAYTQTARWLDEDLIGVADLTRFELELIDEWERQFEWMLDELDPDADEAAKKKAGKLLLRELLDRTGITIRARYQDPFFARGQRHMLADRGKVGWHPDFQVRLEQLLQVSA